MRPQSKFILSERELLELANAEKQLENKKLLRKVQTIKMKHLWLTHQVIANFFWITIQTVTDWLKVYRNEWIQALVNRNYSGKQALLSLEQIEIIKTRVKEKPFRTAKECVHFIKENFWIEYHLHSMQKILKKNFIYHSRNKK